MRILLRNLVTSARRFTGTGAVHNARLEVDRSTLSIVELDRQLDRVVPSQPFQPPRRAA